MVRVLVSVGRLWTLYCLRAALRIFKRLCIRDCSILACLRAIEENVGRDRRRPSRSRVDIAEDR